MSECRRANEVISLIGDKWTVHLVMLLVGGRRRFTELQRAVDGISRKMLTSTLRALERDQPYVRSRPLWRTLRSSLRRLPMFRLERGAAAADTATALARLLT